jgi:hypothetical protein
MSMKVTFGPKGTLHAFDLPNCDAWVIENAPDFDEFLRVYEEKSALAGADFCLFSSFDDYDQACYTSGHAMGKYDLDPPYDDEQPELSCDEMFQFTLKAFRAQTLETKLQDLKGKLESYQGEAGFEFLKKINTNPTICIDKKMVMQIVPVQKAEDALAAFPNGYFTDDLTPFENHALAKHLREKHDYKLIAIGAQFMCYYRREPATKIVATDTLRSILPLFNSMVDAWPADQVVDTLLGKQHLVLPYVPYQGP